ncbi:apolipoprotein D-like [Amphiura filiformis]|uniref:apolipoprotein D-like n=1 Tax=Amphiura filiformis TaxID=82378 RepID=UPI003B223409
MEFSSHLLPILLLALSATAVHGGIYWDWGGCPDVTTKADFDIEQYLGTWYQIARYPAFFQSDDESCTQATYSPSEKGDNYVDVLNQGLLADGSVDSIQGEAYVPDPSEPGKLLVRFSPYAPAGDYWVLDTDYDVYALVHSCSSFFFFHTQIDWILSQQRTIEETALNQIYEKLRAQGVSTEPFMFTSQTNCPFM